MKKNNRRFFATALMLIGTLFMIGCQAKKVDLTEKKMEHATLVIKEDGTYQSGVVSSFEEDYYSVDRLSSYVSEQIEEYKKEHSGADIEITKVEAKEQKASVVLTFKKLEDYSGFNDVEVLHGTVQQLMSVSSWPSEFTYVKKGNTIAASDLKGEDTALIVTPHIEATDIVVEGEVLYVSGGILLNDNTYQIEAGTTGCIVYKKK